MLWPLLIVSGVVYLAMPRTVFATYMADQRLPIAVAFMVIACIQVDLRHRLARRGFAVVLVLLLAVRVAEVQVVWDRLTPLDRGLRRLGAEDRPGRRVLVVLCGSAWRHGCDRSRPRPCRMPRHHREVGPHPPRSSTWPGKQILRVRRPYRDFVDTEDGNPPTLEQMLLTEDEPSPDGPRYWDLWPQHFDYVYLLFTEPGDINPDPDRLVPVFEGARFQLYKVIKPVPPS